MIETKDHEKLLVDDAGAVRVTADPAKPTQKAGVDPTSDPCRRPTTKLYRNRYKCPYGSKNCGENAVYCEACNKDCEEYLLLLNDDR